MSDILSFLNNNIGKRIGLKYFKEDADKNYKCQRTKLIKNMGLSDQDFITAITYLFFGKPVENTVEELYGHIDDCQVFIELFAQSMTTDAEISNGMGYEHTMNMSDENFIRDLADAKANIKAFAVDVLSADKDGGNIDDYSDEEEDSEEDDIDDEESESEWIENMEIYAYADFRFPDGSILHTKADPEGFDCYYHTSTVDSDGSAPDGSFAGVIDDYDDRSIRYGYLAWDALEGRVNVPFENL